jgi:hypothetical protein
LAEPVRVAFESHDPDEDLAEEAATLLAWAAVAASAGVASCAMPRVTKPAVAMAASRLVRDVWDTVRLRRDTMGPPAHLPSR